MNSRLIVFLVVLVACSVGIGPAALAQVPQEEPQAPDDTCLSPGTPEFDEAGCDRGEAQPADLDDEGPGGDDVPDEAGSSRQVRGAGATRPQTTGPSERVSGAGVESRESRSNGSDVQSVQLARTGLEA